MIKSHATEYLIDEQPIEENTLVKKVETIVLPILEQKTNYTKQIWDEIDQDMKNGFSSLGNELQIHWIKRIILQIYWKYISRVMIRAAKKGSSIEVIEHKLGAVIKTLFKDDTVKLPYLRNRAKRSLDRIQKFIQGTSVLDLGCGDGMLLKLLHQKYDVLGVDITDYRSDENKQLPFLLNSEGSSLNLKNKSYDNTILWTVLHHSNDPTFLLQEAIRVTKRRIIIIEGYVDDPRIYQINCFLDWFANRPGKNEDVNVPLNFKTTEKWKNLFRDFSCKLIYEEYLGIEKTVPERHSLFVLEPPL
jgi:2-polyprenyl-3-methyl-5-hydroxy-6-metoxy-1,4-benzoquinol methylase